MFSIFISFSTRTIEREHRANGEFSKIGNEIIDRLDYLISTHYNHEDKSYRLFLIETLGNHFTAAARDYVDVVDPVSQQASNNYVAVITNTISVSSKNQNFAVPVGNAANGDVALATSLAAAGARFLNILDTFLEMSILLRDMSEEDSLDDERMWVIVKLMRFLKDNGRRQVSQQLIKCSNIFV